jgi:hypothetical protein
MAIHRMPRQKRDAMISPDMAKRLAFSETPNPAWLSTIQYQLSQSDAVVCILHREQE